MTAARIALGQKIVDVDTGTGAFVTVLDGLTNTSLSLIGAPGPVAVSQADYDRIEAHCRKVRDALRDHVLDTVLEVEGAGESRPIRDLLMRTRRHEKQYRLIEGLTPA